MNRGRKPIPKEEKLKRGTLQPCRDGGRVVLTAPADPPVMPPYLTPEAQDVWFEEIGRVVAAGMNELDSSFFARYCASEAALRKASLGGHVPPASFLGEVRKMSEALGICGPSSRVRSRPSGPSSGNPFGRNGRPG